jgi:hypothetical protein
LGGDSGLSDERENQFLQGYVFGCLVDFLQVGEKELGGLVGLDKPFLIGLHGVFVWVNFSGSIQTFTVGCPGIFRVLILFSAAAFRHRCSVFSRAVSEPASCAW